MWETLRPIPDLLSIIPGLLLAYLPVKPYLKQSPRKILMWALPLFAIVCIAVAPVCARLNLSEIIGSAAIILAAMVFYIATLRISLWKSVTIALSVCALFACLASLTRSAGAFFFIHTRALQNAGQYDLATGICYNALCWISVAIAWRPARHAVREMVADDHFAQTWYVFWILPIIFIALNLFMIPRHRETLYTGRISEGYFVVSLVLLILLAWFYAIFLFTANSLNRNARLEQENHLLNMQRSRYENLKSAIEDARQARHDMRHHFNQLSALAAEGDLNRIREYLAKSAGKMPALDMKFCENRAADSVIGYYCALARREGIPFQAQIDLPDPLSTDEIDLCLALSNLLENALEASLRADPVLRQIRIKAYVHAERFLLIQVENACDGEIHEKNGIFQSSKRKGNGIGIQSVRRIAEKNGGASTFACINGIFTAKVMLRL